ncbi:MAG TPA: hypothetical protein VK163_06735 [Opitutaceae bacterium]|nr:hypothetical protein [Opitutaceae bacterium]
MRTLARIMSYLSLAGVVMPPTLYLGGVLSLPAVKTWMLASTLVWFATVPVWMGRKAAPPATKASSQHRGHR